MERTVVAANVRRLRLARGWSQAELACEASLSPQTVKAIEGGRLNAGLGTLRGIGGALGVGLADLARPVRDLKAVRFRSSRGMRTRENILAEAARGLDDYAFLEEALGEGVPCVLDRIAPGTPVETARRAREAFGLDEKEPIHDICGLVESAGVRVLKTETDAEGFFGLSLWDGPAPAILVNVDAGITVERRIFTVAHELGHLLLHRGAYDITLTAENEGEEKDADVFAGHFLVPPAGLRSEWADTAGLPLYDRILKVKRIFRVSYRTVIYRLSEGRPSGNIQELFRRFSAEHKRKYRRGLGRRDEPLAMSSMKPRSEPVRLEEPDFQFDRFPLLVRRAFEKGEISLSRAAEMLGADLLEMRRFVREWREAIP